MLKFVKKNIDAKIISNRDGSTLKRTSLKNLKNYFSLKIKKQTI